MRAPRLMKRSDYEALPLSELTYEEAQERVLQAWFDDHDRDHATYKLDTQQFHDAVGQWAEARFPGYGVYAGSMVSLYPLVFNHHKQMQTPFNRVIGFLHGLRTKR